MDKDVSIKHKTHSCKNTKIVDWGYSGRQVKLLYISETLPVFKMSFNFVLRTD